MNGSNGKRRKIRRSAPPARPFQEPGSSPAATGDPKALSAPEVPSQCARCDLPFIGDPVTLKLDLGQGRAKTFHVCATCMESFDRWVARPTRRGVEEPIRRRVKQTEIADAMISRRRSRGSRRMERQSAKARRKFVQTVIGWMLALSVLLLVFISLIYFAFTSGTGARVPGR